ncbi:unnamed protein product [Peniophora sp. CBMAI 1063]|nr:unnamed protein product [Peniophora sp. CBMAI 1063]
MSRTRTLSLSCAPCNMHRDLSTRSDWPDLYDRALDLIYQLSETHAPLLESLVIHTLNFTDNVFSGIIPRKLRSVELIDCSHVAPTSAFFGSPLTHLSIDFCISWNTIDDMLIALTALPHLEHFKWDADACAIAPPFMQPEAHEPESLALPRLQYLSLCIDIEQAVRIIPILNIPSSTTLVIAGELMQEPLNNTPSFVDLLDGMESSFEPRLRRAFPHAGQGFQRVSILPYREENVDGFTAVMETPTAQQGSPTKFEFGACWGVECHDEYMLMLQEVLGWPGIGRSAVHLNVDHAVFLRSEIHWRQLLEPLSAITGINVCGPAAAFLFRALHTSSGALGRNLESITVKNVDARVVAMLLRTLDRRVERSLPPLELGIHQCQVDSPILRRVESHPGVKGVQWDGQVDGQLRYGEYDEDQAAETA